MQYHIIPVKFTVGRYFMRRSVAVRSFLGILVVIVAMLQFSFLPDEERHLLFPVVPDVKLVDSYRSSPSSTTTSRVSWPSLETTMNISIIKTSPISSSSPPGPLCLVHIGKTAGGTLSCRFGTWLAKSCEVAYRHQSFAVRHFVQGKFHKAKDWGCLKQRGSSRSTTIMTKLQMQMIPKTWLFTIRHPLDRIASWFTYENIHFNHVNEISGNRPALFDDCFDTLDDLSQFGLQSAFQYSNGTTINASSATSTKKKHDLDDPRYSAKCAKRAWDAITGQVGYQYHNQYNYRYYMDWVEYAMGATISSSGNYTILVIRSEHLEEDWNILEALYGGDNISSSSSQTGYQKDMVVKRHQSNSSLLPESYPNLCRALCKEIQVYTELLQRAINLTPFQRQESLDELYSKCPPSLIRTPCEEAPIQSYHSTDTIIPNPSFPNNVLKN